MRIEKIHKIQEVFNTLEQWEDCLIAFDKAAEEKDADIPAIIQKMEEAQLNLRIAWQQLKFELQKEKEDAETT